MARQIAVSRVDLGLVEAGGNDAALEVVGNQEGGDAAEVFEGEPPLLLNFEDPQEMQKKQAWLRDEIARTVATEAEIDDEIQQLYRALAP